MCEKEWDALALTEAELARQRPPRRDSYRPARFFEPSVKSKALVDELEGILSLVDGVRHDPWSRAGSSPELDQASSRLSHLINSVIGSKSGDGEE